MNTSTRSPIGFGEPGPTEVDRRFGPGPVVFSCFGIDEP
jgi:hypothetical protein